MSQKFDRRSWLSLAFLRARTPRPRPPAVQDDPFSLEEFYRQRAATGADAAPMPPLVVRVLPGEGEDQS